MTTLAKNHPLEIVDRGAGFAVVTVKEQAEVLEQLFHQYQIACTREQGAEEEALVFDASADRVRVEQILLEYETSEV